MKLKFGADSLWGKACIILIGAMVSSWSILLIWQLIDRNEQSFAFQAESFGHRIKSLYDNQGEFTDAGVRNPIRQGWASVWPNRRKMMPKGHMEKSRIKKGWAQEKGLITRFTYIHLSREPLVSKTQNRKMLKKLIRQDTELRSAIHIMVVKKEYFDNQEFRRMPPSQKLLLASVQLGNGDWLNIVSPIIKAKGPRFSPLLAAIGLINLMVVALALYTIHRALRPLSYIERRAQILGRNMAVEPLKIQGPREIRQVQTALNRMQKSIQQNFENRTTLLAALSHDLKTPLTRLRLRAEFMEDVEEQKKSLQNISDMEALITEIMSFARLQSGTDQGSAVNFSSLVEAVIDDSKASKQNVKEVSITPNITIKAETIAVKRVVNNLIDNALRYAGDACISLAVDDCFARLDVRDHGDGIPENELEKLWQPFKRGEQSRNRYLGGTGLGLASVRMIVESLGGKVKLENCKKGRGLRASIWLPIMEVKEKNKLV